MHTINSIEIDPRLVLLPNNTAWISTELADLARTHEKYSNCHNQLIAVDYY